MNPASMPHLPWVLQGQASRWAPACQEHPGGQVYPSESENKSQDNWVCFPASQEIRFVSGAQRSMGPLTHSPRTLISGNRGPKAWVAQALVQALGVTLCQHTRSSTEEMKNGGERILNFLVFQSLSLPPTHPKVPCIPTVSPQG